MEGKIDWFDHDAGVGFIQPSDGSLRVFVHKESVATTACLEALLSGETVAFEIIQGSHGPTATKVRRAGVDTTPAVSANRVFQNPAYKGLYHGSLIATILSPPEPTDGGTFLRVMINRSIMRTKSRTILSSQPGIAMQIQSIEQSRSLVEEAGPGDVVKVFGSSGNRVGA